jgi:hypothetical protein
MLSREASSKMRENTSSPAQTRRNVLRRTLSTGLAVASGALVPAGFISKAAASGRHSAPPQCLPPASSGGSSGETPSSFPGSQPVSGGGSTGGLGGSGGSPGSGAICFLKGTRITTDQGPLAIEELNIGDQILTHRGNFKTLKWIGKTTYKKNPNANWNDKVRPVCIKHSAIEQNIPNRDLYVSPAHALFLNGVLISAKQLINHITIEFAELEYTDQIEYFHLEFDVHEVIYAEGALAESFQALQQREMFSNFGEYGRLYRDEDVLMEPYAPLFRYRKPLEVALRGTTNLLSHVGIDMRDPVQRAHATLLERARSTASAGF